MRTTKTTVVKSGQGVMVGLAILLGSYSVYEFQVNLLIGVILAIFTVVVAIIAFSPDIEAGLVDMESIIKTVESTLPKTSDLKLEYQALSNEIADLVKTFKEIDTLNEKINALNGNEVLLNFVQKVLTAILKVPNVPTEPLQKIITSVQTLMKQGTITSEEANKIITNITALIPAGEQYNDIRGFLAILTILANNTEVLSTLSLFLKTIL